MVTTALVFFVFEFFQNMLVQYLFMVSQSGPLQLAPIDYKIWLEGPFAPFAAAFMIVVRITGIAFLIYLGFRTRWFCPIILYCASLPVSVVLLAIVHRSFGIRSPSLVGFMVIPVFGAWMWFTV